jgi:HEAT repeat protein
VGTIRPDIVSKFLNQLIQSAVSPSASAWGSIEAAATIISTNTDLYGDFTPALLSLLQQKDLRKEVAWAVGKVATVDPRAVRYAHRALRSFLQDPNPVVRGYAAWSLGSLGYSDALDDLLLLESDEEGISLWRDSQIEQVTVGMLAKEAVGKLTQ